MYLTLELAAYLTRLLQSALFAFPRLKRPETCP